MEELYHYTTYSNLREIKKSGVLYPTEGFHNRTGVWFTKLKPTENTKEEILYNNYKYSAVECVRKLRRVVGFVKILIPQEMVENISRPWNHPDQDVWIWPDYELDLQKYRFRHEFGTMNGTEDNYLKESSQKSRLD